MKTTGPLLALLFALMPGYALAMPITDTVVVDGREWAQLTALTNVSWNELSAVCPAGQCTDATLADTSLAGWNWATAAEVGDLFNVFTGTNAFSVPNSLRIPGTDVFDFIAALGFRESSFNNYAGWTSSEITNRVGERAIGAAVRLFGDATIGFIQDIGTDFDVDKDTKSGNVGAWLFREPALVSSPGTVLLILSAAVIFLSRKLQCLSRA